MRPSPLALALAVVVVLVYVFFTEFLLIGGINLGLLTEGALSKIGLWGIWSALVSLAIAAVATWALALLFTAGRRRR